MTKSEFQELQARAASSGTTLKDFIRAEGVAYSTYNYWYKKILLSVKMAIFAHGDCVLFGHS